MHGDLMKSVIPGLYLTYELLKQVDYDVYSLLSEAPTHQIPHFALSWILTWFSHDLSKFSQIQLIFDACLSQHPCFIFYLCVATIMYNKDNLFMDPEEIDCHAFVVFK
mmetsp:Transcript_33516/g.24173  ORF Transcript_33516/g.24173 Transcript_33516/m.24173 type:complete len:108 (+) Transcript_33516:731-1054(+)